MYVEGSPKVLEKKIKKLFSFFERKPENQIRNLSTIIEAGHSGNITNGSPCNDVLWSDRVEKHVCTPYNNRALEGFMNFPRVQNSGFCPVELQACDEN